MERAFEATAFCIHLTLSCLNEEGLSLIYAKGIAFVLITRLIVDHRVALIFGAVEL